MKADFINYWNITRDYLFKDRPNDEPGARAEITAIHILGLLVLFFAAMSFNATISKFFSAASFLIGLFVLIQWTRGNSDRLLLFPAVLMTVLGSGVIFDGKGSHDLMWINAIGIFLLVNIDVRKNQASPIFFFGALEVILFIAVGVAEINGVISNPFKTTYQHIFLGAFYLGAAFAAIGVIFYRHRSLLGLALKTQKEETRAKDQYKETASTLELQVKKRALDVDALNQKLDDETARLRAAAEITQELTKIRYADASDLLARAARVIAEKLGYYHVGIFLVDRVREYAVLRAANSEGGQEMLTRHHQLKIGGAGVVGFVAQSGRPRIALDTGVDAVFFNNPYLPKTRSEISIPIKIANVVLGVLDAQSDQPAAFAEEDANILAAIAGQLAALLQLVNADDLSITPSARRAAQLSVAEKRLGYTYSTDGSVVFTPALELHPRVQKAVVAGETVSVNRASQGGQPLLAIPVKLRDETIGVIQIESSESNRIWDENEILLAQAVSERAALALENARLLEDATLRAEQEETISRLSEHIGASTNFERIMQTTIQELGAALGASRSFIQIGGLPQSNGKDAE
ncbi:MAG: GAF domain-containing protein [Anaerolineales bacterium]|nr:GAF domain-containing protein [Anaerolineales bacterium]